MDSSGQHNLSIALRHILQQFMDSTNSNGHSNTDMTLPHDGYIQRLSWYFECDKCQYKTFYSPEMEHHKSVCYIFNESNLVCDSKPLAKKRKLGLPRRTPNTFNPPPLEDSDPDSQMYSSPGVQQSEFPSSVSREPAATITSSEPIPMMPHSLPSPQSVDATSVEFDAHGASPDYDTPTIPEIEDGAHKALDFDSEPTKEVPTVTASLHEPAALSHGEAADAFDPDILEIKVEVEPPITSTLALSSVEMPVSSDLIYSAGIPENSVESMMSMFGSSAHQSTPVIPPSLDTQRDPPSLHNPTDRPALHSSSTFTSTPPTLYTPSQRPSMHTPGNRSLQSSTMRAPFHNPGNPSSYFSSGSQLHKAGRKSHPPHLSVGNVSSVKTPTNRPHGMAASSLSSGSLQPAGVKVFDPEKLDCGEFAALSDAEFIAIPVVKRLIAYRVTVISPRQLQQLKYCTTALKARHLMSRAARAGLGVVTQNQGERSFRFHKKARNAA